jgi:hypothetical protein
VRSFNGALVIRAHNGRVFYEGKWRDSRGRQVKRRIGPAWMERGEGEGGWCKRRGRVPEGWFDEKSAIVELRRLVDAREEELLRVGIGETTFEAVAAEWLHHLEHIVGAKPSTLEGLPLHARPRRRAAAQAGQATGERTRAPRVRRSADREDHHGAGRALA